MKWWQNNRREEHWFSNREGRSNSDGLQRNYAVISDRLLQRTTRQAMTVAGASGWRTEVELYTRQPGTLAPTAMSQSRDHRSKTPSDAIFKTRPAVGLYLTWHVIRFTPLQKSRVLSILIFTISVARSLRFQKGLALWNWKMLICSSRFDLKTNDKHESKRNQQNKESESVEMKGTFSWANEPCFYRKPCERKCNKQQGTVTNGRIVPCAR